MQDAFGREKLKRKTPVLLLPSPNALDLRLLIQRQNVCSLAQMSSPGTVWHSWSYLLHIYRTDPARCTTQPLFSQVLARETKPWQQIGMKLRKSRRCNQPRKGGCLCQHCPGQDYLHRGGKDTEGTAGDAGRELAEFSQRAAKEIGVSLLFGAKIGFISVRQMILSGNVTW